VPSAAVGTRVWFQPISLSQAGRSFIHRSFHHSLWFELPVIKEVSGMYDGELSLRPWRRRKAPQADAQALIPPEK
jgi:hypothetical protein